ncbi:MAG: response regulator [Anaerolineae bacterium]|nr:response regulator [Anaerolineae bacterium]
MKKSPYRILIVDDLDDWRTTLGGLLRDDGFFVEVADSRENAISALETENFDLALIDMRLDETQEGDTTGLSLASEIRQRRPGIKIVIITGYDSPDTAGCAIQPNDRGEKIADEYMLKQDAKAVPAIIKGVLSR